MTDLTVQSHCHNTETVKPQNNEVINNNDFITCNDQEEIKEELTDNEAVENQKHNDNLSIAKSKKSKLSTPNVIESKNQHIHIESTSNIINAFEKLNPDEIEENIKHNQKI